MYYYFNGILTQLNQESAVVECAGVGYLLSISGKTYSKLASLGILSATGEQTRVPVKLYSYYHVREDISELYGFFEEEECTVFKLLITVSGIGPRAAIAILSTLSVRELVLAVAAEDAKAISRAQGVGLKTAQKIIIELKDKILKRFSGLDTGIAEESDGLPTSADNANEALNALMVLGYTRNEALSAVKKAEGSSVEDIIRAALKLLM